MARTIVDDQHVQPEPDAPSRLLSRRVDLAHIDAETVAWLIVVPLALLLRITWLHGWPLSPDEASAALATWSALTQGQASTALPAEFGPVAVILSSAAFFLFGAFDDSARLAGALAGTASVAACWWLRPHLGRTAALVAAFLLTWSPLALYETRRLQPEPLAALWLLIMAIALFRLFSGGGRVALTIAAGAAVLAIYSHFLALPVAVGLALLVPLAARLAGTPAEASADRHGARRRTAPAANRDDSVAAPALSERDWGLALIVAVVLVAVLALIVEGGGLALLSSMLSPSSGWRLATPPADRGVLFVPLLLLLYEPLALLGGIATSWMVGGTGTPVRQRFVDLSLVMWIVIALLVASLAGDRSPAQALYPLLPLLLLTARGISALIVAIPWTRYWRHHGATLTAVSFLALAALVVLLNGLLGLSRNPAPTTFITLGLNAIVAAVLVGATIYLMRPFPLRAAFSIVGLTVVGVVSLYTLRSATQLAFVQPARATELAVQEQTSPGMQPVIERIHRLSRDLTGLQRSADDLTGGHGLEIAIDQTITQPFAWYFRDYPRLSFFDPASGPAGSPQLVILHAGASADIRSRLDQGYAAQTYPFVWSFPANGLPQNLFEFVRYLLYREPAAPVVATDVVIYLRQDVASQVLFTGQAAAEAPETGLAFNLFDSTGRGRGLGQINAPRGIAVDAQGQLVVVDTVNARVQKFSSDGIFQAAFGSAGTGQQQFGQVQNGPGPTGVAIDAQGFVYVADTWNHRIVKLTPDLKFVTSWGSFTNTQGNQEIGRQEPLGMYGPRSVAIGPDGNLYVTDTGNKRVLVFTKEGQPVRQWGGLGSGPENLNEPVGIAIDQQGTVYVADTYNGRIALFDLQGKPLAQWPVPGWTADHYQEAYIAVARDRVYVTSGVGHSLLVFDKQGKLLHELTQLGEHVLVMPTGITVGPDGVVYVVDTGANKVVRYTPRD